MEHLSVMEILSQGSVILQGALMVVGALKVLARCTKSDWDDKLLDKIERPLVIIKDLVFRSKK